ncbi:lipase maturation factor 2 isoform X2 [Diceros bicornis minor]|uniref:lipase maturation factor 2 isoform X2 n=1 Tax=Diceros bicornis minor TaxID=77932 RepID=UPI0026EF287B|nr:lipase maturation factor 2 isoform X2 [Diceros bicornis minor]
MAGSRVPRQLFLQGVAAVFMFAFASLYMQIPGLYGAEGILPARRTLRPQGKGRWQQLWETPTLLWEAPRLGLDTAQGLELLNLLGTLLALGALLLRQLRHLLTYLLLWAAYLSAYQVGQVFLYFQWDSLLLETGFLAMLVAPLRQCPHHKQAPQGGLAGALPHEGLPFWLVRWLLFRLMFASGVVKLTSRCPVWWGLTALTYHYETQCLPTPASWFAHHLPVWLHKLSVVATFLIEIAVPPLFFAPVRRLRLAAFYSQVLLQVLIIITGNYNFFNLLTLVLTTSLLDDEHLAAKSGNSRCRKTPTSWPRALLAMLSLLLELTIYGLLAYGTVHYFGLEVDWEQHTVRSRTTFTFHQFSQWLKMVTLPTMWLGVASLTWELLTALWRWTQVRGWLRKLCAAVQLSIFGTATVALFTISLVPYSYVEPSTHGRLWTGAHRLFGTVEHLQLANSYGLFRRMTGLGGRPEVVLEGSYDGHHWTEIEFMYKPGNVSRPPSVVVPHQPRLDWQMWFAALGPHTHSPWFTSLVLRLLQGKEPVIRLLQNDMTKYPFHKQPPTYLRAQRYKYWFSQPGEQGGGDASGWRNSSQPYPWGTRRWTCCSGSLAFRTRAHPGPTAPAAPWPRPSTGYGNSCLTWRLPLCSGGSSSPWGPLGSSKPCWAPVPPAPLLRPGRRSTGQPPRRTWELPANRLPLPPTTTAAVLRPPGGKSSCILVRPRPERVRVPSTSLGLCSRTWPSHRALASCHGRCRLACCSLGQALAALLLQGHTCPPTPTTSLPRAPSGLDDGPGGGYVTRLRVLLRMS